MSSWREIGDECLNSAKYSHDGGFFRTAISRAYYAAYAHVSGALVEGGVDVARSDRPNPSHQQLDSLLAHNLDTKRFPIGVRRDLARRVRHLRRFRVMSDYDPASYVDQNLSQVCLRDASIVSRRLGGT